MAERDWFRNETWSDAIASEFAARLRRARGKAQYLRIQATYLAISHPEAALSLLDQYFDLGMSSFDLAQAYNVKGQALASLGDIDAAIVAYEAALLRERGSPGVLTQSYLDLPLLLLETKRVALYPRALKVLEDHRARVVWPVEQYRSHGARALLLQHFGRFAEAREQARLAMTASARTQSGFRYHQDLGLVRTTTDGFGKRVKALAEGRAP
ncbi:MAG: hypothetical protein IT534_07875 [Bauldia sp.]|nr:hypothetical protein [Bauldia sp.]